MASEDTAVLAVMRELAARIDGRMDGLDQRMDETRADAREARDAAITLTERFGSQDVPKQIAELKAEMRAGFVAARTDLVNSSDKMRSEISAHHERLKALEDFKQRVDGATGFVGWIGKHLPWMVTLVLGIAAGIGWRDNIPS